MEPIVVTATRTGVFGLSEMEWVVGSLIVVALLAWMVVTRVRRDQQPHA